MHEPATPENLVVSERLAGLLGPTVMVLAATEAINIDVFEGNPAPVVYLNGTLLFIAGLAIVRRHHRWSWHWSVLVTLLGWGAMLAGAYRMAFPEAPQAEGGASTYAGLLVLFCIGAVLTVASLRAWWGRRTRSDR